MNQSKAYNYMKMGEDNMDLKIYKDNYTDATAVSNIFIDEYMKDANDAQLKIYLYLIRMMNSNLPISISDIADKFNHTEKDVLRALRYWEKNHLLSLEYDEERNLSGIHLLELNRSQDAAAAKALAPIMTLVSKPAGEEADPYAKPNYTLDQLKIFKSNETTSQLLFIVEQYIGKTLTPSEMKTIFFLSDKLGFSVDLIDYLVQYCLERGKKDFRYIEKVAISWAQEGVTTPEQAEKHSYRYEKIVYDIMKALGKSSAPTNKEVDYIRYWTKVLGYDMDVIAAACERTVLSTDKHRFEYADSILKSWHSSNVHHFNDIARADENYKRSKASQSHTGTANKFNQFAQNNYDFDALEKELLRN